MVITLIGSPDDEHDSEINIGISEVEEFLRIDSERSRAVDVGMTVITIIESGFRRGVGHVANSGFVTPKRDQKQEVPPGFFYLN